MTTSTVGDPYERVAKGDYRLTHDGLHWAGSFQKVLKVFVEDLLEDGPINVVVDVWPAGNENSFREVAGNLIGITDTHLVFDDGATAEREWVLAIYIP